MVSERELQQSVGTLELYRAQLDALSKQAELFEMSHQEHNRALETLKAIKESKEGSEILVPIGASSFIFAKLKSNKRAIVGIGSGISVEEDIETAIEHIERLVKDIEGAEAKINETISKIEREATALTRKVQDMYKELQEEEAQDKKKK